jgi:hypothetical protein
MHFYKEEWQRRRHSGKCFMNDSCQECTKIADANRPRFCAAPASPSQQSRSVRELQDVSLFIPDSSDNIGSWLRSVMSVGEPKEGTRRTAGEPHQIA